MLNRQTIPDKYAIPLLTDFVDFMTGSTIFSSLDLNKSYHQIEVVEEDLHKTAILTPLGSFAFKKMPMGLTSAGNTFQRFMNEVTRGLCYGFSCPPSAFRIRNTLFLFEISSFICWRTSKRSENGKRKLEAVSKKK